jgi:hypothetical protein
MSEISLQQKKDPQKIERERERERGARIEKNEVKPQLKSSMFKKQEKKRG